MYRFVDYLRAFHQACEYKMSEAQAMSDDAYTEGIHDAIVNTLMQISDKVEASIHDKVLACPSFNIFAPSPDSFLELIVEESRLLIQQDEESRDDAEIQISHVIAEEEQEDLSEEEEEALPDYSQGLDDGEKELTEKVIPALLATYKQFLAIPKP